jgi:hypothetical protein
MYNGTSAVLLSTIWRRDPKAEAASIMKSCERVR